MVFNFLENSQENIFNLGPGEVKVYLNDFHQKIYEPRKTYERWDFAYRTRDLENCLALLK